MQNEAKALGVSRSLPSQTKLKRRQAGYVYYKKKKATLLADVLAARAERLASIVSEEAPASSAADRQPVKDAKMEFVPGEVVSSSSSTGQSSEGSDDTIKAVTAVVALRNEAKALGVS